MYIKLILIGKNKHDYEKIFAEYLKYLNKFCKVEVFCLKESKTHNSNLRIIEETNLVKKHLSNEYVNCILDAEGIVESSEKFADRIEKWKSNNGKVCFIIGGSYGLDKSLKDEVDICLSFSKMTFTHQMIRIILLEQIYRAFTIINGQSYHK